MQFKRYIIAVLGLVLAGFGAQAQDFFMEDFAGGIPASWSNVKVAGDNAVNSTWVYTLTGPSGSFSTDPLASTTASGGWVMFDSDANCSGNQNVWLITPAIDASDKTAVWLKFQTFYRSFYDIAQVRVGTNLNDLNAWATYEVFPGITPNDFGGTALGDPELNPQNVQIDLSADAAGVAAVYVAFQFLADGTTAPSAGLAGCAYNWQIDDVVLTETDPRPANQMQVNTFAAVAPNAVTPASQVEPIGFIADIANFGSAPNPETTLSMTITNSAGATVFTDELVYGLIGPDSTAENRFFANEFTPPAVPEVYTATYALDYEGSETDAIPANNTLEFTFVVSDSLFSKDLGATRSVAPAADDSYTYGNTYTVNSSTDVDGTDLFARYISFGVANADELAGRFVTVLLLEWPSDADDDFIADQDEYTIVGFNSYEFTGAEGNDLITVLANDGDPVQLNAGSSYIAAIQYETADDQAMFLLGSEEFDYAAMTFYTDSLDRIRYSAALDVGNEGSLSMVGFGQDIVPVVRLSIGAATTTRISEVSLPEGAVSAFPNPADAFVNVDFNLEDAANGTLTMFNTQGQVVYNRSLANVTNDRIKLETNELPAGTYLIRVSTEQGVRNMKVTVQH